MPTSKPWIAIVALVLICLCLVTFLMLQDSGGKHCLPCPSCPACVFENTCKVCENTCGPCDPCEAECEECEECTGVTGNTQVVGWPYSPPPPHNNSLQHNIFFTWVSKGRIPDRAVYTIIATALVYGKDWTIHILATREQSEFHTVLESFLVKVSPVCSLATIQLEVISLTDELKGLYQAFALQQVSALVNSDDHADWVSASDIARALFVYKYGGVYLDMDLIPVKPILVPTVAVDYTTDYNCFPQTANGMRPQYGKFPDKPLSCMANGVFALPAGHELVRTYLLIIQSHIQMHAWGSVGPKLLFQTLYDLSATEAIADLTGVCTNEMLCIRGAKEEDCITVHAGLAGSNEGELTNLQKSAFKKVASKCMSGVQI